MSLHAATRRGKISRRKREFKFVMHHVKKRGYLFAVYLRSKLRQDGDCQRWTGSRKRAGYGRLTLRMNGERLSIDVHRLFLILKLKTPIPVGYDAGHQQGCPHRDCVAHVFKQHFADNAETDPTGSHFRHGGDF